MATANDINMTAATPTSMKKMNKTDRNTVMIESNSDMITAQLFYWAHSFSFFSCFLFEASLTECHMIFGQLYLEFDTAS